MEVFKICYRWHEGEYDETHLCKEVTQGRFEQDLLEAREFAISLKGNKIRDGPYLGKGYSVECLPEFYEQIIWFLIEKKGYADCHIRTDTEYEVDDDFSKNIHLRKHVDRVDTEEL
jgi:hypothetical protein